MILTDKEIVAINDKHYNIAFRNFEADIAIARAIEQAVLDKLAGDVEKASEIAALLESAATKMQTGQNLSQGPYCTAQDMLEAAALIRAAYPAQPKCEHEWKYNGKLGAYLCQKCGEMK